jgi:hypothetical protein
MIEAKGLARTFHTRQGAVEAMRVAFRGDYATWAVAEGVVVAAALVWASVAFGTRTFRRENV